MKMSRVNVQLSVKLKSKLDAMRDRGYTASGFIRSLLEREFNQPESRKKGR